jgi:hypothetical protein
MTNNLLTPILNDRTRSVNFFNGRLLTGEDLTAEQQANRVAHSLLGQAVGSGVAYGLEVAESATLSQVTSPVLSVKRGLAINPNGGTLLLDNDTDISLVRPASPTTGGSSVFQECLPMQSGVYIAGAGVYLLTIGPASATQGLAEVSGVSTGVAPCNSKYKADGVQFRLVQLDLTLAELGDVNHLRNLVAYKCFGVADWAADVADPFGTQSGGHGLIDQLRVAKTITGCEVPLAVLYWTASDGVVFVDMWSVRRALVSKDLLDAWVPGAGRRRFVEGLAMFLQFQEQVVALAKSGLSAIKVTDYFNFIPAVGLVPVTGVGSVAGLSATSFFDKFASGTPTVIDASRVAKLVQDSCLSTPVDLTAKGMLQLYEVQANIDAVGSAAANQLYILYISRDMFGFIEHDLVANAFGHAWEAYRGLVKKRVFLPSEVTSDAVGARLTILAAEQDVLAVANQKAALAAARTLNYKDSIDAFSSIYQIQSDLALLFMSAIPGITDPQGRVDFGKTLKNLLDVAGPAGIAALKISLTSNDLHGAAVAQEAINSFVGSWTGSGVAIGFIAVKYNGSSARGTKLVPGDPLPYPHSFNVSNSTDRSLQITLAGSVVAAHGDWSKSVAFQNTDGLQIGSVTLASGTNQDIVVLITVPASAQIGDAATLNVVVNAPAPNNKQGQASLPMTIEAASGPPVVRNVKFTQVL